MIERACDGEQAFDVIVVHKFSRFFRDAFGLEFYVRSLPSTTCAWSPSPRSWAMTRRK
jgi:hypothetical protein